MSCQLPYGLICCSLLVLLRLVARMYNPSGQFEESVRLARILDRNTQPNVSAVCPADIASSLSFLAIARFTSSFGLEKSPRAIVLLWLCICAGDYFNNLHSPLLYDESIENFGVTCICETDGPHAIYCSLQ